ncbi:MAG: long-chain fatty acid--CoA ligase, partial [Gramella sp.]|nr:long-chain fatty acid--CoA ligase [Christiangramia sp.]
FVSDWAKRKNIDLGSGSEKEMANNKLVRERIQEEIDFYNQKFGKWERIKTFELTPEAWTIDDGHLTPTMKLKRRIIKERYKDLYEKLYGRF